MLDEGYVGSLTALVRGFEPTDPLEAQHRQEVLQLLSVGPKALRRDHYSPGHVTASAFVLSPDRTELLLIFHSKLSRWLQPGGHLESVDEDVVASCLREVHEETGVSDVDVVPGLFDVDVHDIPASGKGPAHKHFDCRVLLVAKDRSFRAGSDALDARWVTLSEVAEVESDQSVMRAVTKLLGNS